MADNGDKPAFRVPPKMSTEPMQSGPTMSEMLGRADRAAELDNAELQRATFPKRPTPPGPRRRSPQDLDQEIWMATMAFNIRAMPPHILGKWVEEILATGERVLTDGQIKGGMLDVFDIWSRTYLMANPSVLSDAG